jgi:hypothetical protein
MSLSRNQLKEVISTVAAETETFRNILTTLYDMMKHEPRYQLDINKMLALHRQMEYSNAAETLVEWVLVTGKQDALSRAFAERGKSLENGGCTTTQSRTYTGQSAMTVQSTMAPFASFTSVQDVNGRAVFYLPAGTYVVKPTSLVEEERKLATLRAQVAEEERKLATLRSRVAEEERKLARTSSTGSESTASGPEGSIPSGPMSNPEVNDAVTKIIATNPERFRRIAAALKNCCFTQQWKLDYGDALKLNTALTQLDSHRGQDAVYTMQSWFGDRAPRRTAFVHFYQTMPL